MSAEPIRVDVTNSPDLLHLVEVVEQGGVSCVLVRGNEEIAIVSPLHHDTSAARGRPRRSREPERILNIIGIGASGEPTDVAQHKDEYLADAAERRAE
jgi:hypothetical protein